VTSLLSPHLSKRARMGNTNKAARHGLRRSYGHRSRARVTTCTTRSPMFTSSRGAGRVGGLRNPNKCIDPPLLQTRSLLAPGVGRA
jgi:hypothetical protein